MDLKEVDLLGPDIARHWYYAAKASAMQAILGDHPVNAVLDVGAGSGFFSATLLEQTSAQQAWCVDTSYERDYQTLIAGKAMHFCRSVDQVSADLMLFMDVIEHVDDDVGLLRSYVQKAPRGTRVLVSVPAFNFLWSGHDRYLGHRRRYTLAQLDRVVRDAGLSTLRSHYYFATVFPIAAAVRLARTITRHDPDRSQLSRHHPMINGLLRQLCRMELSWMAVNRFAGLTAFNLSYKP